MDLMHFSFYFNCDGGWDAISWIIHKLRFASFNLSYWVNIFIVNARENHACFKLPHKDNSCHFCIHWHTKTPYSIGINAIKNKLCKNSILLCLWTKMIGQLLDQNKFSAGRTLYFQRQNYSLNDDTVGPLVWYQMTSIKHAKGVGCMTGSLLCHRKQTEKGTMRGD